LVGISGVNVIVTAVDLNTSEDGLSPEDVRNAVELMLRIVGIPVLTDKQVLETSEPMMRVATETLRFQATHYVRLSITLLDFAKSTRTGRGFIGNVWDDVKWYPCARADVAPVIREGISLMMTAFCNDFLAANGRTVEGPRTIRRLE
jgi:hypothetical protein